MWVDDSGGDQAAWDKGLVHKERWLRYARAAFVAEHTMAEPRHSGGCALGDDGHWVCAAACPVFLAQGELSL